MHEVRASAASSGSIDKVFESLVSLGHFVTGLHFLGQTTEFESTKQSEEEDHAHIDVDCPPALCLRLFSLVTGYRCCFCPTGAGHRRPFR